MDRPCRDAAGSTRKHSAAVTNTMYYIYMVFVTCQQSEGRVVSPIDLDALAASYYDPKL